MNKEPEMCKQMPFASIQYSKMQLRPGLRPEQHWESQHAFPRSSLAGFNESLRGVE